MHWTRQHRWQFTPFSVGQKDKSRLWGGLKSVESNLIFRLLWKPMLFTTDVLQPALRPKSYSTLHAIESYWDSDATMLLCTRKCGLWWRCKVTASKPPVSLSWNQIYKLGQNPHDDADIITTNIFNSHFGVEIGKLCVAFPHIHLGGATISLRTRVNR